MRDVCRVGLGVGFLAVLASASAALGAGPPLPQAAVLETFPNDWHVATLGLAFDPVTGVVRYAHEGSSEDPATVWDVDLPRPHDPGPSYNLSALNASFPVTLNDRDGVAFDPATETWFLPDYQGDLSVRDDNIVEIDGAGTILNAWELDGAGNDSSDASAVNTVLDIAIIPGSPNRYFLTAADGSGVIFEVALTRSGLWTASSWSTVDTCTPALNIGDSSGIDYDATSGHFFVTSFASEVISEVDLSCNVISQFICDGPGTIHTGLAVLAGANPPQVWVTDFNSNATTRCAIPPALFADGFESEDTGAWSLTVPPA